MSQWRVQWTVMILLIAALAGLAACASNRELTVKELPAMPEPSLPPVELQEARVGPGDEVDIFVWRQADLSRRVKISRTGLLSYPLLGDLRVSGMTPQELQDILREGLEDYVKDPQVSVSVVALRHEKIFVFGEVHRPGAYTLDPTTAPTLVEAMGLAGGMNNDANKELVLLIRGDPKKVYIRPVDFDALMKQGDMRENERLAVGDIIYVPTRTMASIQREARRIVDILQPVLALQQIFLSVQTSTVLWDQFTRILRGVPHSSPISGSTSTTVVITGK